MVGTREIGRSEGQEREENPPPTKLESKWTPMRDTDRRHNVLDCPGKYTELSVVTCVQPWRLAGNTGALCVVIYRRQPLRWLREMEQVECYRLQYARYIL